MTWGGVKMYSGIQVQIGVHGILADGEISSKENFYQIYKEQYRYLIDYLLPRTDRLILAGTTPAVEMGVKNRYLRYALWKFYHPRWAETLDKATDCELRIRNKIAMELALEYHIPFHDLYSYMETEGRKFKHMDRLHYVRRADGFMARRVLRYLEAGQGEQTAQVL